MPRRLIKERDGSSEPEGIPLLTSTAAIGVGYILQQWRIQVYKAFAHVSQSIVEVITNRTEAKLLLTSLRKV